MELDDLDQEDRQRGLLKEDPENDGEFFGWQRADDFNLIGYMYYFMLSTVNLVETKNDDSPIIDNKGNIRGYVTYSVTMQVLDNSDKPLNILLYDSLNELVGKRLVLTVEIKKAKDIPERQSSAVHCRYSMINDD